MNSSSHTEVAIVGSGIVGLAMALAHHRKGRSVTVFDRSHRPLGATIRNFGMVWPVGQPAATLPYALRSREIWAELAPLAGFWAEGKGSLQLAYHDDEVAVLQEFMQLAQGQGYQLLWLNPTQILEQSPATRQDGLLGGLFSATEMIVDPREAATRLVIWLESQGVRFVWGKAVTAVEPGRLLAGGQEWTFVQAEIASGADFEGLFPDLHERSGMTKVKLQMMRTAPQPENWRMGPALCGGLTLTHYGSFAKCPSLPQLRARFEATMPWMNTWGIHVMMSQNGSGELVIGDSHEYGNDHDPFLKEEINTWILDYLGSFVQAPDLRIAERWSGVYAKLPGKSFFVEEALPGVRVVNGLSGAGMTLSFGLAEALIR